MPQVPEKLTNYTAYRGGTERLGTVDVELPNLEALTETVSGAGIAGEVDSPTLGHYGSMETTLNFRTLDVPMLRLAAPIAHALDFRGSQQVFNSTSGQYESQAVRVSVRAIPKTTTGGTLAVNATTGSSISLECIYYKVVVEGRTIIEIDKYNFICTIDGVDYMAKIRENLGM